MHPPQDPFHFAFMPHPTSSRYCSQSPRCCVVGVATLNQWALDFEGNLRRIKASISRARSLSCTYLLGPELSVTGYGCEDHFLELDTETHSWEALCALLRDGFTESIVVDVGMPIVHRGVRYNCRVVMLDGKILLIRPKRCLADDGNYREPRYFTPWRRTNTVENYHLPDVVRAVHGQETCPFGDAILRFDDTTLGFETCEELFTPDAPHIRLALNGVEIIANGSGSHHQLRKLNQRLDLIQSPTRKMGGVYLYANCRGCDGGRLYYDGCSCVVSNGDLVAQGSQFAVEEVEVTTARVDLDSVVSHRAAFRSMADQASHETPLAEVHVKFRLCSTAEDCVPSDAISPHIHAPEEEIALGPACWLWDYLRRSRAAGYLLPLSGGADSSSTAAIVGSMCQLACTAARSDARVASDVRRLARLADNQPLPIPNKLAACVFTTLYLGTENSGVETRKRSEELAKEVGARHMDVRVDSLVAALVALFAAVTGKKPRFKVHGGTIAENLALQNIQARLRMVVSFLFAQLLPWVRGESGFLLVLGSANVDEALRGYMTKYDCSSADINPIGGISKVDLKAFLRWGADNLGYPSLAKVEAAPPTAELEPLAENGEVAQTDEVDMGMTYAELSVFGRLRKMARLGPVSMFQRLRHQWASMHSASEVATKVKRFFTYYAMNRHKMTTLTPSYHAESYSPDDNRHDLRPFLYNTKWPWQFARIDQLAATGK